MPCLTINGQQYTYSAEGEGFPLLLVPDRGGAIRDWAQSTPLLGELCRVVAYEYTAPLPVEETARSRALPVEALAAFLDALAVERAYLAGYAGGGQTALRFALRYPRRVEGLLLIGGHNPAEVLAESVGEIAIPMVLLVGDNTPAHLANAHPSATQTLRWPRVVIPGAGVAPHREQPLRLGHAMLDFLLHCERQRTLVRGASFLL
ncbi:MAG TPA: alpha/beta hydrolase [Candidatus Tectomicrobia bacterium]|jgi:pimeloyl-ACP methyl ester carboxylesterase